MADTETTTQTTRPAAAEAPRAARPRRQRRTSLLARGEPMVWLTGGSAAASVIMIIALLAFITWQGFGTFWPAPVHLLALAGGQTVIGEPTEVNEYPDPSGRTIERIKYKTANYDVSGTDFTWVDTPAVKQKSSPKWALTIERQEWQNAYGILEGIIVDGREIRDPQAAWDKFNELHGPIRNRVDEIQHIKKHRMGAVAKESNDLRLSVRRAELSHGAGSPHHKAAQETAEAKRVELAGRMQKLTEQVNSIWSEVLRARLIVRTSGGQIVPADRQRPDQPLFVWQVVRAYPANQLSLANKASVYTARWWEYLTGDPREANMEGGVWPAIFGTVLLTFIMILFVVPVGVIAAVYLREYAKQGLLLSIVRISVNNLAGVPSIVFGVFGLGFFCYGVGRWIDAGPRSPLTPGAFYSLMLATGLLVAGAIGLWVLSGWAGRREKLGTQRWLQRIAVVGWVVCAGIVLMMIAGSPFFGGFYPEAQPDPTVGKSALIWASLTLALLTLPVVIVATEEALAAVPSSMREGSYACGASKWQTIRRIVLPRAMPGIMTGTILAIARGAGEVAPLMLVGAVKLAPELPVSGEPPFFGTNQSFMHLGFHIYDLALQSRNAEAAIPMVYTTTFLLISIVVVLNLAAMLIRTRLRKAYAGGHF